MKIDTDPRLPVQNDVGLLRTRLYEYFRQLAVQLNNLSEGKIAGRYSAATSVPTGGTWQQGDVVYNSTPTETGTAGSKYTVTGWICTVSGTPGTWVPMRALTGN